LNYFFRKNAPYGRFSVVVKAKSPKIEAFLIQTGMKPDPKDKKKLLKKG
jgi:hypothetical protein